MTNNGYAKISELEATENNKVKTVSFGSIKKKAVLRVMIISSSYPQNDQDWKSVFIRQMVSSLAQKSSIILSYWGPGGKLPENVTYSPLAAESKWLNKMMELGGLAHIFRYGSSRRYLILLKYLFFLRRCCIRQKKIDLYHVNWLQNILPLWSKKVPLLITVLGSDFGFLHLPGMTWLIRCALKNKHSILAPNAEWMMEDLERKFGDISRIVPVPLGINECWFDVYEKRKEVLPRKWIVVTRLTSKKIGRLFEWGENIFKKKDGHELHLFGPMQESINLPEWVVYHGPTFPDELLEKWFPVAAGLISMSQHDEGRPQVMLEAMAAGLPIIASDIPAHRNFIVHKKSGWLVDSEDSFVSGVQWLSHEENKIIITSDARRWVKEEVGTWADCADRYEQLYHRLISDSK